MLTMARSRFKMFKVSTSFTPRRIIERVLQKSGDECNEWILTEVIEKGDGKWSKVSIGFSLDSLSSFADQQLQGMSIEYTGGKANNALKTLGWSEKRGDSLPPVWLVVHKA